MNNVGVGVGCLLIDLNHNKTMLVCRLEFECTNNVVEHEDLVQGIRKEIDLKVKCIKVFGDSHIVIRQVRDSIHCSSHHLRNYH